MEIKEHYEEVLDVIDGLFVSIFEGINARCKEELGAVNSQFPFEPLQVSNLLRTWVRVHLMVDAVFRWP